MANESTSRGGGKRSGPGWRASRRQRLLFTLIALGMSFGVGFLIAEVGVRLAFGSPQAQKLPLQTREPNKYRGWQLPANSFHYSHSHRADINNLGLRDRDVGEKESGELRILALGDSLTFGDSVPQGDSVPARLEKELNARAGGVPVRYRVVNGGIGGYSTIQELGLLRELGPAIDPDIVILFWYWNDMFEEDLEESYERTVRMPGVAVPRGWDRVRFYTRELARSSATIMLAHDLLGTRLMRKRFGTFPGDSLPEGAPYPAVLEEALVKLNKHLRELETLAAAYGARCVFVMMPHRQSLKDAERPTIDRVHAGRMAELARELGMPVIDPFPPMCDLAERKGDLPEVPYDGHYNSEGNAVMAVYLADELLRMPWFARAGGGNDG